MDNVRLIAAASIAVSTRSEEEWHSIIYKLGTWCHKYIQSLKSFHMYSQLNFCIAAAVFSLAVVMRTRRYPAYVDACCI